MKKLLITQSNYIPWKGYFDAINLCDEMVIYDDMQYTRRDWRNRNKIKTPQGPAWITVPVDVSGKYFQKINETQTSEAGWAKSHWSSIKQNYSKAPFFKEYQGMFEEAYLNMQETFLTQINCQFIKLVNNILGITTPLLYSSDFTLAEERTERLVNICVERGATSYYSGPAAKAYMNESLFAEKGIEVNYFNYSGYPEYNQLYPPFSHEVSILDLIFNEGPNAKNFMKSFTTPDSFVAS